MWWTIAKCSHTCGTQTHNILSHSIFLWYWPDGCLLWMVVELLERLMLDGSSAGQVYTFKEQLPPLECCHWSSKTTEGSFSAAMISVPFHIITFQKYFAPTYLPMWRTSLKWSRCVKRCSSTFNSRNYYEIAFTRRVASEI